MDEDRIGLVLAKTSELRSKIVSCISGTAPNSDKEGKEGESKELENHGDGVEEESESLLNIKDALESLEGQLSSLQVLFLLSSIMCFPWFLAELFKDKEFDAFHMEFVLEWVGFDQLLV